MDRDFENLTLTELVRLQSELSQSLTRRFERRLALTFSDIVGSTAYFARFAWWTRRATGHFAVFRPRPRPPKPWWNYRREFPSITPLAPGISS
jgi:hypothetical protein